MICKDYELEAIDSSLIMTRNEFPKEICCCFMAQFGGILSLHFTARNITSCTGSNNLFPVCAWHHLASPRLVGICPAGPKVKSVRIPWTYKDLNR